MMVKTSVEKDIFLAFSNLLNYPDDNYRVHVEKCISLLPDNEISEELGRFLDTISEIPISRLEEIYGGTFDISPSCCIYAGYQLLGEGYKRSEFLVGLNAKYKEYGFEVTNELPDHLSVLFKFLSQIEPFEQTAQEILRDCLLPSLEQMIDGFDKKAFLKNNSKRDSFLATVYKENEGKRKEKANPYRHMLKAIKLYVSKSIVKTLEMEEIS